MSQTMSDPDLINLIRGFLHRSENYSGSTLSSNRDQATDYYLGRINGRAPADEGLSAQLSGDVADMTDAVMSEVCFSLLSSDQIVEVEPEGDEDRMGARIETAVCNKVIMDQNCGYAILSDAVQAAALYKNGIVAVEPQTIKRPRTRYVGDVPDEQAKVLEGETGGDYSDGQLSWTEEQKRVVLRNVAPENWFTDKEFPGWSLKNTNFCAERIYYSRGDLIDMGYDKDVVDDLNTTTVLNKVQDVTRRYATQSEDSRAQSTDEQQLVECYRCYIRLGEADGSLRLYYVLQAGDKILERTPCDMIQYAIGKIIPVVGRFHGVSINDRLKPIEDGITQAFRQMEDNLSYTNNSELVLGSTARVDDAKLRIPGGYIRADDPNDVVPLPTQDLTSNATAYLAEMRQLRSERGGSALDMQRADSQLMRGSNQVGSMGVGMLLSAAEMRSAWYCRNLAETLIRQVFELTHETLRRYEMDPVGVWVANQYIQVDTRQFREREVFTVRAGLSSGERVRKLQALDTTIQYQLQAAQIAGPGVLSNLQGLYALLTDRDRCAGIDTPQRYWLDPESQQSQQAQQANAQSQQQMQQTQEAMAAAEIQDKRDEKALDKYKHDTDLEWKYFDTRSDNDMKEAELVVKAAQSGGEGQAEGSGNAESGDSEESRAA